MGEHVHIIKLVNAVIDDVRRRVQNATTGHRGRKYDQLYQVRKLLLKACGDLDVRGWQRLADGLRAGDPDGEVTAAWQLKEITRDLYRARDIHTARDVVALLYAWANSGDVAEGGAVGTAAGGEVRQDLVFPAAHGAGEAAHLKPST